MNLNGRIQRLEAAAGKTEKPTADDLILAAIRWRDSGPEERRTLLETEPSGWRRDLYRVAHERDARTA
ncbi:MAG: hypothetical protein EPO21_18065 [Chloroflexota bacterium]|nr:MAG: hypothetical protein EPO21_18065 [Chloroflexota bacterium]